MESADVEKWKLKEKEAQEKIEADAKDLEKLASKLNILQQKIVECTQKITELGALPSHEAYSKFSTMSTKQLFKEMEKANNHLKKYRCVFFLFKHNKLVTSKIIDYCYYIYQLKIIVC